jgi:hypothetical protein
MRTQKDIPVDIIDNTLFTRRLVNNKKHLIVPPKNETTPSVHPIYGYEIKNFAKETKEIHRQTQDLCNIHEVLYPEDVECVPHIQGTVQFRKYTTYTWDSKTYRERLNNPDLGSQKNLPTILYVRNEKLPFKKATYVWPTESTKITLGWLPHKPSTKETYKSDCGKVLESVLKPEEPVPKQYSHLQNNCGYIPRATVTLSGTPRRPWSQKREHVGLTKIQYLLKYWAGGKRLEDDSTLTKIHKIPKAELTHYEANCGDYYKRTSNTKFNRIDYFGHIRQSKRLQQKYFKTANKYK